MNWSLVASLNWSFAFLSLHHSMPASLASSLFLKHARHTLPHGLCTWSCPLLGLSWYRLAVPSTSRDSNVLNWIHWVHNLSNRFSECWSYKSTQWIWMISLFIVFYFGFILSCDSSFMCSARRGGKTLALWDSDHNSFPPVWALTLSACSAQKPRVFSCWLEHSWASGKYMYLLASQFEQQMNAQWAHSVSLLSGHSLWNS